MSARYRLPCRCGQDVPVRLSQAGESVVCECGESLDVPSLQELRRLDPLEPSTSRARRVVWSLRQVWISVGLVVTVLGLSYLVYVQWTRPRRVDVETLSPAQTWILWSELRVGANRNTSGAARQAVKVELSHRVSMVIAILAVTAGVLTTGAAYVLIKPTRVGSSTRVPHRPSDGYSASGSSPP